jgi:sugar/nucleoside kinase (ribokinase family)
LNTVKEITIAVFGDLMLDVVTYLPDVSLTRIEDQKELQLQRPIDVLAGGTAVHAALRAIQQGFSSATVMGKVGFDIQHNRPDNAAEIILASLREKNVRCLIACDRHLPTGTAMITYLANDSRLFFYDRGANNSFNVRDIRMEMLEAVRDSDISFFSGYSLLAPEQATAVLQLMEAANDSGRFVVLDLVPHKIYKLLDRYTFQKYARLVSLLVTEVDTIKHFLPESINTGELRADEIAAYLLKHHKAVVLRPTNITQYIFDRHGFAESIATGYDKIAVQNRLGFSDRLNIDVLSSYYWRFVSRDN